MHNHSLLDLIINWKNGLFDKIFLECIDMILCYLGKINFWRFSPVYCFPTHNRTMDTRSSTGSDHRDMVATSSLKYDQEEDILCPPEPSSRSKTWVK